MPVPVLVLAHGGVGYTRYMHSHPYLQPELILPGRNFMRWLTSGGQSHSNFSGFCHPQYLLLTRRCHSSAPLLRV